MANQTTRLAMILAATLCGTAHASLPEGAPSRSLRTEQFTKPRATTADSLPLKPQQVEAYNQIRLAGRDRFGLSPDHDFQLVRAQEDALGQHHVRFQQTYRGLRVFGGYAIVHSGREGRAHSITDFLKDKIEIDVVPDVQRAEALATALADLNPKGPLAFQPVLELVILPIEVTRVRDAKAHLPEGELNAEDMLREVTESRLAYHIQTGLRNGNEETSEFHYLIDARSGAILKKWDSLYKAGQPVVGTGNSQFSGVVNLNTLYHSAYAAYELYDNTRTWGTYGVSFFAGDWDTPDTDTYWDVNNTWGDGANYSGGGTQTDNGQTAAVDVQHGIGLTVDYFHDIHGRIGIRNNLAFNNGVVAWVHYGTSYDGAFWSNNDWAAYFGDGSLQKTHTSLDIVAHELSHGAWAGSIGFSAPTTGETGGLVESNSDIFGNMVELYSKNNKTLPATTTNSDSAWTVAEDLATASYNHPQRYLYKPSKDGASPNAWSTNIGNLDPHFSCGPNNRMFFFLSQGASATASSDYYSSYVPWGFAGVGPAKAAAIWYRAFEYYLTNSSTYADARQACLNAVADLYPADSAALTAVKNAYGAINVGLPETSPVVVSVTPATKSVNQGAAFKFTGSVTGTENTGLTWTVDEAGGGTVNTKGRYTAPNAAGTYHVRAKSVADSSKFATATVTVPSVGISILPTTVNLVGGATQTFTATVTGTVNTGVSWSVVEAGGGSIDTAGMYTAPSTTGTYHVQVTSSADSSKTALATVNVSGTSVPTEQILNGGFESGATNWSGATGSIGKWAGQPARTGLKCSWLMGYGTTKTQNLYQQITIPSTAASATLTFWLHVDSDETTTAQNDTFAIQVRNSGGSLLGTLGTFSNLDKATGYSQKIFDLSAYKGQTIRVYFLGNENASLKTSFVIDDVSVQTN